MEPTVLFKDEDLLVINKPAGVTVNRAETTRHEQTVQDWIEEKYEMRIAKYEVDKESDFVKRAGIVHRLDKETSGVLVIAKNQESFENLQRQFKERTIEKKYIALVHGEVPSKDGEINVPVGRLPWNRERFGVIPGGRESVTKYKVISSYSSSESRRGGTSREVSSRQARTIKLKVYSLLELFPLTGRTHQIRVHLKYLGHSVVADPLYGGRKQAREDRKWCHRLFLHASKIAFSHPISGKTMMLESSLPGDLQSVVERLR